MFSDDSGAKSQCESLCDHDLRHLLQLGDELHVLGHDLERVGRAHGGAEVAVEHVGEELLRALAPLEVLQAGAVGRRRRRRGGGG